MMPGLSFFKRTAAQSGAVPRAGWSDEQIKVARVKAHRRLTGAVVLALMGALVLPMVFDTDPRPVPSSADIEVVETSPLLGPSTVQPSAPAVSAASTSTMRQPTFAPQDPEALESPTPDSEEPSRPPSANIRSPLPAKEQPLQLDKPVVVQIGAYSDQNAAAQMRQKLSSLGLKTYTELIDGPSGKRIRVRMGPFKNRQEAQKILDKLHRSNMSGVILSQ
jgi:DedD protein